MQIKLNLTFSFRIIFLWLAFIGIYTSVHANEYDLLPVQQNRKLLKLNGNVSSVKEEKWVLKLDTAVYNTTASIELDTNFLMVRSEEASFDKPGNILQLRTISLINAKDNITKDSLRYYYYTNDRLIGIANLLDNKRYDSMFIHYNKNNLLDYFKVLDVNNGVEYKMEYAYKDKKVISMRREDGKKQTVFMASFLYRNNELYEVKNFDAQEKLVGNRKFSFSKDKEGNKVESFAGMDIKGRLKGGMTMTKNAAGDILDQNMVDESSNIYENYHFNYDAFGNRLGAKIFSNTQTYQIEYRYTYDEHHNWIRKESFTNDILTSIIVRTIHYN